MTGSESSTLDISAPGTYLFRFMIEREIELEIGRLGQVTILSGYHIYVGSALRGLKSRLRRHFAGLIEKPHWHIDRLSLIAVDKSFAVLVDRRKIECELNAIVAKSSIVDSSYKGFGCSDCRCPSHLHRLKRKAWPRYRGLKEIGLQ